VAYVTKTEARAAARARYGSLIESELRKSAQTAPTKTFDVFLSHASEDAAIIAGVKAMFEREGLSVYVDWIDDTQLDRRHVTPKTADALRNRMNRSRSLVYASSVASTQSKWMPWELGYFDGRHRGHVWIMPLVETADATFRGLEYLGLYPLLERFSFLSMGTKFGVAGSGLYEAHVFKSLLD
jgi:hypothetical protein